MASEDDTTEQDITGRTDFTEDSEIEDDIDLATHCHCLTDQGNKRLHNEDAFYASDEKGIWAVADGMGGHNAGDYASQKLMQTIAELTPNNSVESTAKKLESMVLDTNLELINKASILPKGSVIGTTIAMLIAHENRGVLLWAGDSRVYRIRANTIEQLTRDHSLVNDMIQQGKIKEEEAENHPESNKITRAVGYKKDLELDHRKLSLRAEDRYIICSDGLTKELSDEDILAIAGEGSADVANQALMDKALEVGGRDNITTVIVDFMAN